MTDEIPSMDVVDKSIAIIINTIHNFFRICPNIILNQWMVSVGSRIDDRNHDIFILIILRGCGER